MKASRLNQMVLVFALGPALATGLSACAREGDENLGLTESHPAVDVRQISRPQVFAQAAALPVAEVVRRLHAHRLEARTGWEARASSQWVATGRDVETAPVSLQEDALVEADGRGGLHLRHENDHGYGSEAVVVGGGTL